MVTLPPSLFPTNLEVLGNEHGATGIKKDLGNPRSFSIDISDKLQNGQALLPAKLASSVRKPPLHEVILCGTHTQKED